jgi:hypothetical protein
MLSTGLIHQRRESALVLQSQIVTSTRFTWR